jgi:hypothetical protein
MASDNPAGAQQLPAGAEAEPSRPLTRREMLIGLAAGGAVLITTNTGTALASHKIGTDAANRRAQPKIDELEGEISILRRQLALYKDMERIGLDRLIRALLETYDRLWPPVRKAIGLLLAALDAIEGGLAGFEIKLPSLQSATRLLGNLLTGMEAQVEAAQDAINELLKRTGPIGEAVSGFLAWLLSKIPFGVGDRVAEAADRLSALVAGVPPLIADVRNRLLGPLDDDWLASADGEGLKGGLFDPLREDLLAPLRTHLEQVEEMAGRWDEEAASLRAALDKRDQIRGEIARLEQAPAGDARA